MKVSALRVDASVLALVLAGATGAHAAPSCRADALALTVEPAATGGSARLVIVNRSDTACDVPGLPLLGFADRAGRAMHASRRVPAGFHPGPVIVPATLPPDGRASAMLDWAFAPEPGGRCAKADAVLVIVGGGALRQPIEARLCGPADGRPSFDQSPLRTERR